MSTAPSPTPTSSHRTATPGPCVVSLATALPPHRVDQRQAKEFAAARFGSALGAGGNRLLEVFDHAGVETRHVSMPLEWYEAPHGFRETNALYVGHALSLAGEVARRALQGAGLSAADVDHIVFVSSTGIATPSLDARLANLMGMRSDVRRTPIWGLGCAGGAAGLSRAADFARADPGSRVLLIALELCTLTFQSGDLDRRNLVAASLFSDGAAAAVVTGAEVNPAGGSDTRAQAGPVPRFEILASRSTLWPETLDMMGWTVDETGFHVVFSRDIPSFVRQQVKPDLEGFLGEQGLDLTQLGHMVAHPGGPKVLAAYAEALGLSPSVFRHAADVLRHCGNMSSPTCLFVLDRLLQSGEVRSGDTAVVSALGPGFAAEYVLMRAQ
jgi:alkylresorcinol/alkylpyrone synthase